MESNNIVTGFHELLTYQEQRAIARAIIDRAKVGTVMDFQKTLVCDPNDDIKPDLVIDC